MCACESECVVGRVCVSGWCAYDELWMALLCRGPQDPALDKGNNI
jgi:hypothetical protein